MKTTSFIKISMFLLAGLFVSPVARSQDHGFAIVELFTSQGCSSCPAADQNLTELLKKSSQEGTSVYGLSFHVDYWNYIGWKDPYSSSQFTQRQKTYSSKMNLESIYTPQMVVNGTTELVGSNQLSLQKKVANALLQKPKYKIDISRFEIAGHKLTINYRLDRPAENGILNAAIVEKNTGNAVTRGENSGHTLRHSNVVRQLITKPLKQEEEIEIDLPTSNNSAMSLILYIQDNQWHIVGATAKSF